MLPWPGSPVSTTASITGTATRTSGRAWTRSSTSSSNPLSPAVTCSWVVPATRSTVWCSAKSTDWFAVCMPRNTPTPRTMPAVVRIVRTRCLRVYGQLISRSRIIAVRPRRRGRRGW